MTHYKRPYGLTQQTLEHDAYRTHKVNIYLDSIVSTKMAEIEVEMSLQLEKK